jgi:hypothetical protein
MPTLIILVIQPRNYLASNPGGVAALCRDALAAFSTFTILHQTTLSVYRLYDYTKGEPVPYLLTRQFLKIVTSVSLSAN